MTYSTLQKGWIYLILIVALVPAELKSQVPPPPSDWQQLPAAFTNPYSIDATSIRPPMAPPMESTVLAPAAPTGQEYLQLEQIPPIFFNPYIAPPATASSGTSTAVAPPSVSETPARVPPPGSGASSQAVAPPGAQATWDVLPRVSGDSTYCSAAQEAEIQNASCPVQPSYVYGGSQRQCAARTRTNIAGRYGQSYSDMIHHHAQSASAASGISPALVLSLLDAESGFNPMSSNAGHDTGMAQFQVPTAAATLRYWRDSGAASVALQSYNLETHAPSQACRGNSFTNITRACIDSLLREDVCGSERVGLRPNLYCPQFSIHLMAWHLKKNSVAQNMHTFGGVQVNVISALQGDGDPVAQARYLASKYNRGCLIENSYVYLLEGRNTAVSARNYGDLWSATVSASYHNHRNRPCANSRVLNTERINRCYMWRVTGLCGGFGDSLVGQYLRGQFCSGAAASGAAPVGGVQ